MGSAVVTPLQSQLTSPRSSPKQQTQEDPYAESLEDFELDTYAPSSSSATAKAYSHTPASCSQICELLILGIKDRRTLGGREESTRVASEDARGRGCSSGERTRGPF